MGVKRVRAYCVSHDRNVMDLRGSRKLYHVPQKGASMLLDNPALAESFVCDSAEFIVDVREWMTPTECYERIKFFPEGEADASSCIDPSGRSKKLRERKCRG